MARGIDALAREVDELERKRLARPVYHAVRPCPICLEVVDVVLAGEGKYVAVWCGEESMVLPLEEFLADDAAVAYAGAGVEGARA